MRDFSLEITSRDVAAIPVAAGLIPAGTRINVTFLSNEEPATTVAAARAVLDAGFLPVPHLAARRIRSLEAFTSILEQLQAAGVSEQLFLIAGDPSQSEGPFGDAASLIRAARLADYDGLIRVGAPGPAGVKRLLRYASRFGVSSSAGIVRKYGFSLANLMGTAGPDRFIRALQDAVARDPALGEVAMHFYTFGGLDATAAWARDFVAASGGAG
jgi:methylenetetrahydrofolate reductase (NADPH)